MLARLRRAARSTCSSYDTEPRRLVFFPAHRATRVTRCFLQRPFSGDGVQLVLEGLIHRVPDQRRHRSLLAEGQGLEVPVEVVVQVNHQLFHDTITSTTYYH